MSQKASASPLLIQVLEHRFIQNSERKNRENSSRNALSDTLYNIATQFKFHRVFSLDHPVLPVLPVLKTGKAFR